MTGWFATPKPNPLPAPKQPSGKRLKVLHISDIHIDPRAWLSFSYFYSAVTCPCRPGYATGYEANCTAYLCCRENVWNAYSPNQVVLPAPRYGSFQWYVILLSGAEWGDSGTVTPPYL